MSRYKFIQLADGTIAQAVVVVDANGDPIVGGSLVKGQVATYANLPAAASYTNEYWLVEQSTGSYLLLTRKERGLYISNGSTWLSAPDIIPYFDSLNFRIYDNTDDTKKLAFNVSNIATGQTRTLTYPDKNARLIYTDNTIHVALNGGDYADVKEANDFVNSQSPSTTNRWTILVSSGEYEVDNSGGALALNPFTNIKAQGIRSVVFKPKTTTNDMFTGNVFSYLEGIVFSGNTGSAYIVNHTTSGVTTVIDCVLRDSANGFLTNGSGSQTEIRNLVVNNPLGTTTVSAIKNSEGVLIIDGVTFRNTSKVTTGIEIIGSAASANMHNISISSADIDLGITIKDGAQVAGTAITMSLLYDGLVLSGNNSRVSFDSIKIAFCQNDGFRIDNTGTNLQLSLFAATIIECTNLNFNVLNPNSIFFGNGFTELIKGFVIDGAGFYGSFLDLAETDEGTNNFGEFHIGTIERPAELTSGEGDSVSRGIVAYTYDGADYVDISTAVKSASGSSFTFPNLLANTAIYISSELIQSGDVFKHQGIKISVLTAAVLGTGNFIAEYWNGSIWVELNIMECQSGGKYYPNAKSIFENAGSHQIRYDSQLANDSWAKNDVMSYGTDLYWIRFRIESALTTSPIFEQWKTHASRSEINSDGWVEYFGKARPEGQLGLNFTTGKPFEGAMLDQTIYVSQDIGQGFTKNKFTATGDKLGISGFLPFDLDTSSKIKLQWSGMASASQTIEWTIRWAWVKDGDTYSTSEPGAITNSRSITVSKAITLNLVSTFEALLDVSEMVSRRDADFGDEIWISIQPSTLSGQFSLTNSQALYTKWSEGGHV